jgi:pimeloyl-ACP methyl ester carboxylesterase
MGTKPLRRCLPVAAVISVLAAVSAFMTPTAARAGTPSCTEQAVAVNLGGAYSIDGRLCRPATGAPHTVLLLVHGYTLSHVYWDATFVPAAMAAGYATFAIDRLGVGESSKPPALAVTLDSNVDSIHQVVNALRAQGFPRVVTVGHSFGAAISVTEAARFHDVDAVVAGSFLHTVDPLGASRLVAAMYPAQLDPKFRSAGLPVGYLTTRPGTRQQFYEPADTDPAMVAMDEATKATGTAGEMATLGAYVLPIPANVTVPVHFWIGDHDPYFCDIALACARADQIVARERLFFGSGASLSAYVQSGAGHNAALERNAPGGIASSLDFIGEVAGP